MTSRFRRIATSLAIVCGGVSLHLSLAEPAQACSCAQRSIDELRENETAALVTRTKSTPDDRVDVLHAAKKSVPPRIAQANSDFGCGPSIGVDTITAVILREEEDWAVQTCGYLSADATFARLLGEPKATAKGTPVAWLAGGFGGARAAALNAAGEVVAWAEPGSAGQIAVCPGATRVVTTGLVQTPGGYVGAGPVEVLVHDATTLRTIRRVTLPKVRDTYAMELRCLDTTGSKLEVLTMIGETQSEYVRIDGARQRRTPLGEISAAAPVRDGFVVAIGPYRESRLFHVRADGTRRSLPTYKRIHIGDLAADPSGTRVVVGGSGGDDERPYWTVDLRTGKTIAKRDDRRGGASYLWPTQGKILTNSDSSAGTQTFLVYDARLRPQGTLRASTGFASSRVAGNERQLAFYGGSARFAAQRLDGKRSRVTDEIRLSAASDFAAAPGRSFDLPSADKPTDLTIEAESNITEVPSAAPLGQLIDSAPSASASDDDVDIARTAVVGVGALALLLGGFLILRRRRLMR